jgi:hypothetical protein
MICDLYYQKESGFVFFESHFTFCSGVITYILRKNETPPNVESGFVQQQYEALSLFAETSGGTTD